MKRGVPDRYRVRQISRARAVGEYLPAPHVGGRVFVGELGERERLPDPPAQLVRHGVHLTEEAPVEPRFTRQRLQAAVSLFPLLAGMLERGGHGRA